MSLKDDALKIINAALKAADPYNATVKILKNINIRNNSLTVLSIGKAAIPMAQAAEYVFSDRIKNGLVVTKYNHTGSFKSSYFRVIEAAHPVSDENSVKAAQTALDMCESLTENDVCIVLLSGGGSALFEKSIVSYAMQRDITKKLLARGADIEKINTIRRRISLVKGGKLAACAYPAKVYTVALSDVLSNDKSTIASGITVADKTSAEEVNAVIDEYLPEYRDILSDVISHDSILRINDGGFFFSGDINSLCDAAQIEAGRLGYNVVSCSRTLVGEARITAESIIADVISKTGKTAYIYGGETTVTIKGNGLGGRNQEMALAAAIKLRETDGILFASVGSDGTDGPTDAAGGVADGNTYSKMLQSGLSPENELENNNSYYALLNSGSLIKTGPTGTNVNDLTFVLLNK